MNLLAGLVHPGDDSADLLSGLDRLSRTGGDGTHDLRSTVVLHLLLTTASFMASADVEIDYGVRKSFDFFETTSALPASSATAPATSWIVTSIAKMARVVSVVMSSREVAKPVTISAERFVVPMISRKETSILLKLTARSAVSSRLWFSISVTVRSPSATLESVLEIVLMGEVRCKGERVVQDIPMTVATASTSSVVWKIVSVAASKLRSLAPWRQSDTSRDCTLDS